MEISAANPVEPMLAKAVASIPPEGAVSYEPKWDGFRAIVYWDGEAVSIGSRGGKWLTRYFPELVAEFARQLQQPCAIDGEIVVRQGSRGAEREARLGGAVAAHPSGGEPHRETLGRDARRLRGLRSARNRRPIPARDALLRAPRSTRDAGCDGDGTAASDSVHP